MKRPNFVTARRKQKKPPTPRYQLLNKAEAPACRKSKLRRKLTKLSSFLPQAALPLQTAKQED